MAALVPQAALCNKPGMGEGQSDKTPMRAGAAAGVLGLLADLFRPVVDYALPLRCPGCGIVQDDGRSFCYACWQSLDLIAPPWCALCHRPLAAEAALLGAEAQCLPCLTAPPRHDGLHAPLAYGDTARDIALRLKYGGRIGLAAVMAQAMLRVLPDVRDSDARHVLLVPVPLHWTRIWARGFNQAALIAAELARETGLAHDPLLLRRVKRTPPLRAMPPRRRAATVRAAFALDPRRKGAVMGKRIWLIDDIYTSGATSDACIRVLKRAGAAEVRVVAFARVLRAGETGARETGRG